MGLKSIMNADLRMGVASADITPDKPVTMVGFGRVAPSEGVLAPLEARVSVWRLAEMVCALVSIDHIGFATEHADRLRAAIGARIDAPVERVMLCFTHTHAGPNDSVEIEWSEETDNRIVAAAASACANMRPVRAGWGNARADFGVNRRNGDCVDRRIGICKVTDAEDGSLRLLILRVSVHNNALKGDNPFLSPDFFGATRTLMEKEYGCPVLVTQGASGNVAPMYFASAWNVPDAVGDRFVRTPDACEKMAYIAASAVRGQMNAICPSETVRLEAYSRHIALTADVPDEARALDVADEALREAGCNGEAWLAEVRRLRAAGVYRQTEDCEIQFFALCGGCLCGVRNEIMTEFAVRASEELADPFFYLGGYTNGCSGYFPTEEEFDCGGYEVYWSLLSYFMYHGRVFPLRRESASILIDAVVRAAHADVDETSAIRYRAVAPEEIDLRLFARFDRHQVVTKCWRKRDGVWQIEDIAFVEEWTLPNYERLAAGLRSIVDEGGFVAGAFTGGRLLGFSSVESKPMGSRGQYRELCDMQVTAGERGHGVGRTLFRMAADWARENGAEKLYISAHSSVESQAFYRAIGCVEAAEYDADCVAREPDDCQMEFVL